MLTLTPLAARLLKAGHLTPVYRIDFGDAPGNVIPPSADWIASFAYSPEVLLNDHVVPVPELVADVPGGLSQILDILTGASSSSSMVVSILDHQSTRDLIADEKILGKDMVVWLGFNHPDWAYSDWIPVYRGLVRDWEFAETLQVTATTFDLTHARTTGTGMMKTPEVPGGHSITNPDSQDIGGTLASIANPLELMTDLLESARVPSRFINTTSFDPAETVNAPLSHLRVFLSDDLLSDKRITDRRETIALLKEVATICRGFVHFDETGQITFTRVIASIGADAVWGDDDLDLGRSPEKTRAGFDDLATSVRVNTVLLGGLTGLQAAPSINWDGVKDSDYQLSIVAGDPLEIISWGWSETPAREFHRELIHNDNLFGAGGVNIGAFDVGSPASLGILAFGNDPSAQGTQITLDSSNGFGWPGIGTTNPVAASRPIYVAVVDPDTLHYAIIEYTGLTYTGNLPNALAASGGTFIEGDNTLADATGGHLLVFDITAAWEFAGFVLSTFVETASRVTVHGKPHTYEVQLGDQVQLDVDRYVDYGFDGDPGSSLFLVVGKDVNPGDLSIQWKLMRLKTLTPTIALALDDVTYFDGRGAVAGQWTTEHNFFGQVGKYIASGFIPYVEDGLLGPTSVTLIHTIDEGFYDVAGWRQYSPPFDHTYTASKDTWCYVGNGAQQSQAMARWVFVEVANGDPQPTTPAGTIPVQRVRTNGTAITEVRDLRNQGVVGTRSLDLAERVTQLGADFLGDCSVGGFDLSPGAGGGSGLAHTIAAGNASLQGRRITKVVDEDHTFTASRLTWVDIDNNGVLFYTEQALATDEPILSATDKVRLMVVETDAADVVHVGIYPQTRTIRSRAISPESIRDGLTPNGLLDDLGVANSIPFGWEKSEGANVTISTVAGTDVKCGRYGVKFAVGAAGGTSYFRGIEPLGVFPISPLQTYTGKVFYTMGAGYVRGPTMSIGLEFFDQDMKTIAVRNFISAAAVPAMDNRPQGNVLTGSFTGVGGGANQIPDTARYAKWVVQADLNALGASGIILSGFVLSEP